MALPLLFILGGSLLRAAGPTIARKLIGMGAKKATKQVIKNTAQKARTITSKNVGNLKKSKDLQKSAKKMQELKSKKSTTTTKKPTTTTKKPTTTTKKPTTTTKKPTTTTKKPTTTTKKPTTTTKKKPTSTTKKTTNKKTTTKKGLTGASIKKKTPAIIAVVGAGSTVGTLMKEGSGQKKAKGDIPKTLPKSRPSGVRKQKDFGMGMVDDFGKGRKTSDMEGGTAPIKPKAKAKPKSTPKIKEMPKKKSKNITAGGNVGFGPKGNIFPSNAAERKRLMDKYGGTGSAAAKAAAQGKQGNLKKVRS